MKKLNFINELGQTAVGIVNIPGETGDGSAIEMYNQLFQECVNDGIVKSVKVVGAANGTKNIYCECDNVVLVKLSAEKPFVAVFDKEIAGESLSDVFEGKSMCLNRNTEAGRGIWRMSYPRVRHYKKETDEDDNKVAVVDTNYPVSISIILWLLHTGAITKNDLHNKNGKIIDITAYEAHHYKADWDNRLDATAMMTTTAHAEYHTENGQYSHQVIVNPTSVEEVVALLDYVDNYTV